MNVKLYAAVALMSAGFVNAAIAAEYPIGKQQIMNGLEIAAVYLQPIKMEPEGMMRKAEESDIHVEADIRAVKNNPNGFAEGDWMPNLVISYEFTKAGSKQVIKGDMMPMVASDGPHYGDNVKLAGPGKYTLKMIISPPSANVGAHFGRHVDKETGVGPWFKPFEVTNEFTFAGVGKKGGY
ncbi:fe2+ transport family protein [Collimonas arenae]|uniref:Fe2+ transport family protein n=1 Tax=Collimonas arenae TaxID=279058 RepID=A0A127QJW0_9BURK|nr:iron transporter [Collimonas arenae]AMP00473.1 fe2+ transport family protein [Collimonas arenae]AMP10351.1 fe2+ transport family protein [Collimonas arenae]